MGQKIITLSGAATDVLYALFFRGALKGGDLPSKSGAAELRELGFAESRHTATKYQEKNFFTFLTAEGQEFAIKHLVNTNFGVPAGGYIGRPLDALDEIAELPLYKISSDYAIQQKIADALDTALARHNEQFGSTEPEKTAVVFLVDRWVAIEGSYTLDEIRDGVEYIKRYRLSKKIQKSMEDISPFVMKDGEVFIKDAFIGSGIVSANYSVNVDANYNGKHDPAGTSISTEDEQRKVEIKADRFEMMGIRNTPAEPILSDVMRQAVINAVSESDLLQSLQAGLNEQAADITRLQVAIKDAANEAIRNALQPGGLLFHRGC